MAKPDIKNFPSKKLLELQKGYEFIGLTGGFIAIFNSQVRTWRRTHRMLNESASRRGWLGVDGVLKAAKSDFFQRSGTNSANFIRLTISNDMMPPHLGIEPAYDGREIQFNEQFLISLAVNLSLDYKDLGYKPSDWMTVGPYLLATVAFAEFLGIQRINIQNTFTREKISQVQSQLPDALNLGYGTLLQTWDQKS